MKNLSIETIEKMLVENFANDFAKMVALENEYNESGVYSGGKELETLINLKENVSCKMVALLLDDENANEYWEKVEFIELTIGNLVEEKTAEF